MRKGAGDRQSRPVARSATGSAERVAPGAAERPPRRSAAKTALGTVASLLTIAAVVYLVVAGPAAAADPKTQAAPAARPTDPASSPGAPKSPASEPAAPKPEPARQKLRVAVWNVRDCAATDPSSAARIALHDYVAQTIKEARADVIVLVEIQSDESKGGDIALLSVALAKAGWAMPFVAVVNARGEDDLALFSRYKISGQSALLEPAPNDPWPRPGIFASVGDGQWTLDMFGFHFKAMGDEKSEKARLAQAQAVGKELLTRYGAGISTRAIVVAGDFNTANDGDLRGKASTLSALCLGDDEDPSNDFVAANYRYRGGEPTFVDSRYSSLLDHILVSPAIAKELGQENVEVLKPLPGPGRIPTSDHNLVLVEIALPVRD